MSYLWKSSLSIALILVLGTSAIGHADCGHGTCAPDPCDPCYSGCDSDCDVGCNTGCGDKYVYKDICSSLKATDDGYLWTLGRGTGAKTFRFDGWFESGIMTNSHGTTRSGGNFGGNGSMHAFGNQRTDYALQQIYLIGEKVMDTSCGFDWGFRSDFMYGNDGYSTQSSGDRSFDYGWARNDHGYGLSYYQLLASVGYKNLNVRGGKFITPIGWEGVAAKDNFFYSHSYCYWIEPSTHVGVLADYAVNDRLTLTGGWTAGHENGFRNRFGDSAYLLGFSWALTPKANLYYYVTQGDTNNGEFSPGDWVFDDSGLAKKSRYLFQSLVYEWKPTKRLTYLMQYNLTNATAHNTDGTKNRDSSYGINNYFLYQLTDKVGVGMRLEWLRDNDDFISDVGAANYYEITYGVNWTPNRHWSVRPEVRFDWADGCKPFADNTKSSQITGGIGVLYFF